MVEATGTTRRGRGARAAARQKRDVKMLPALKRNLPLTEPMNQEQIERMDAASMHILENVGVQFRDPIALGRLIFIADDRCALFARSE
jgi:trimethylamine--corrinoid protein Co-methyltransferase